jgi:nucleotide-binding universal stress UspA family protein
MTFQKILCPTDFSEASYEGLKKAVELARRSDSEVCVVHVDQPTAQVVPIADNAPYAHSEGERRAEAVANLCAILEELVPPSVRARPLLKCGDATTEILRAAREEGADLIVLTTHGAGTARPGGLGSVAEEIVRTAPCSVLTVNVPVPDGVVDAAHQNASGIYGVMRPQLKIVSEKALFLDGD